MLSVLHYVPLRWGGEWNILKRAGKNVLCYGSSWLLPCPSALRYHWEYQARESYQWAASQQLLQWLKRGARSKATEVLQTVCFPRHQSRGQALLQIKVNVVVGFAWLIFPPYHRLLPVGAGTHLWGHGLHQNNFTLGSAPIMVGAAHWQTVIGGLWTPWRF